MIHIGPIRKIWRGRRLLIFAFVDDDSSLKSQFVVLVRGRVTGKIGISIGKGYDAKKDCYPRLIVGIKSWIWGDRDGAPRVICGIGRWEGVNYDF